jgi:phage-related minor tail protein
MRKYNDIVVKTDLSFEDAMKALVRADKGKVDKAMEKVKYPTKKGLKSAKKKESK